MRGLLPFIMFLFFSCYNALAQQLVLPGDNPDPSVVKIGDTYWASATTSNWLPAYPLLKSKDLVRWESAGSVFSTMPEWADYYFWAPEITYENGKVFIYYSAHKKNGNLCLGVASADKPEGPYKDHGALMCQPAGSIDAFPIRDSDGKLFLIWKEDGNSVKQPTPIWAQEMNEERTALIGEKKELFRNSTPWEANLVEGVSMIRHGDYLYAFYAAAGCCGAGCTYNTGVARAKNLLGPWEKYEKNPILTNTDEWKCPGHGTPVEKDGKYYFLYHAYHDKTGVYAGRQGLLAEFSFTSDGWIEFVNKKVAGVEVPEIISDEFRGRSLSDNWQWSVFQNPGKKVRKGRLTLGALPTIAGAFLGQKTYVSDYDTDVLVLTGKSDAESGIAIIGDDQNIISVLVKGDTLKVVQVKANQPTEISVKSADLKKKLWLRAQVRNNKEVSFLYSTNGKDFLAINEVPVNGSFLPPWDRAVRTGLISRGSPSQKAVFDSFSIKNQPVKNAVAAQSP